MSDDWRLRVDLHEDGSARALAEHLGESALEHDLDTSFHDRVVVSREGAGVFCYTGTKRQAQKTEMLVHAVATNLDWHVDAELTRWHPSTEVEGRGRAVVARGHSVRGCGECRHHGT